MARSQLHLRWQQATLNSLLRAHRQRLARLKQRKARQRLAHIIEMAAADLRNVNARLAQVASHRERRKRKKGSLSVKDVKRPPQLR